LRRAADPDARQIAPVPPQRKSKRRIRPPAHVIALERDVLENAGQSHGRDRSPIHDTFNADGS
jgi:hypothetical protein